MLERQEGAKAQQNPPNMVQLWIADGDEPRRQILKGKKLKIAVIPFEKVAMTEFPVRKGAVFEVEYTAWHKKNAISIALKLLDEAIKQQANIVIFPEFVCSMELQEAMQEHLQQCYKKSPRSMKTLLFVVAGSGWTEDDNNVSCIFSYNGRLLGRQYKQVNYYKIDDVSKKGHVEGLENPGQEMTICEVEGIGQIMFAICRDVSERGNTGQLARIFRPQFLLVPAWSPSVHNGFEQQFEEIIEQNHRTCCVVCNCCEAFGTFGEKKKLNGIIATPYKEESLVRGMVSPLERGNVCWQDGACGSCLFLVELDFSNIQNEQLKIVKKITRRKLKC